LYAQVIAAAAYAWLLLHERLAPVQIAGGVVVLGAIALARRTRAGASAALAAPALSAVRIDPVERPAPE
jgi:drug/metabolite transporter (DMT)-like permease